MDTLDRVSRPGRWGIFVSLWLLVTWGTLGTPPTPPALEGLLSLDKLIHAGAWALLTITGLWAWDARREDRWRVALVAFLLAVAYGLAIEVIQGVTRHRSQEWLDLLADAAGAGTVALLYAARARARRSD